MSHIFFKAFPPFTRFTGETWFFYRLFDAFEKYCEITLGTCKHGNGHETVWSM